MRTYALDGDCRSEILQIKAHHLASWIDCGIGKVTFIFLFGLVGTNEGTIISQPLEA